MISSQNNPSTAWPEYDGTLFDRYRMRIKRKRLLFQAFRKRSELVSIIDRTNQIADSDILVFSTIRNEILLLPFFLAHYRRLGIRHFLIVDNGSRDGSVEYLRGQPDVSLWSTENSYKAARFGVDWLNWLRMKYAHDRWCLTVDVDELLIYPYWDVRSINDLTDWLNSCSIPVFGSVMLEMYPRGPTDTQRYETGQNPLEILQWFDAGGFWQERQWPLGNLWLQGGPRARVFFSENKQRAPTLNKIPLIKWNRRYTCVNSTHSMLPPQLNLFYDGIEASHLSGVLFHVKFLHTIAERSLEERDRAEHFHDGTLYRDYYEQLSKSPNLWSSNSTRYENWEQLVELGLMSTGGWNKCTDEQLG